MTHAVAFIRSAVAAIALVAGAAHAAIPVPILNGSFEAPFTTGNSILPGGSTFVTGWTTVFTGRLPRDHGVKSFAAYRLRGSPTVYELLPKGALVTLLERASLVSTSPVTAASRKRLALWNALNAFGIQAGVVRFWGTHPPEHVSARVTDTGDVDDGVGRRERERDVAALRISCGRLHR